MSLEAAVLSAAQVAACYPSIRQPPHTYYELRNKHGLSHFPPGLPSACYVPFIAYFLERAETAAAQLRLYRRKCNGGAASQWLGVERGWRQAARVATMRQARALEAELAAAPIYLEADRPPFEWDDPAAVSEMSETAPAPAPRVVRQADLFAEL